MLSTRRMVEVNGRAFQPNHYSTSSTDGAVPCALNRVWPNLERYGVVVQTRTIGKAKIYRLNSESKIAENLVKLALQIAKVDADNLVKASNKRLEKPVPT
jgi:hypothetical protein